MTNAQLDQRAAELLGWTEHPLYGYYVSMGNRMLPTLMWSPSTNLAQAMGLWAEHRPERGMLAISQRHEKWAAWSLYSARSLSDIDENVPFTDLPHAITKAWCEAEEHK